MGNRLVQDPSGLRIGTQEVTRIGFGKSEMKEIAKIMGDLLIRHADPESIRSRAETLKSNFREIKYCFGKHEAYKYIEIIKM